MEYRRLGNSGFNAVDDPIVVVENVERWIERGPDPKRGHQEGGTEPMQLIKKEGAALAYEDINPCSSLRF